MALKFGLENAIKYIRLFNKKIRILELNIGVKVHLRSGTTDRTVFDKIFLKEEYKFKYSDYIKDSNPFIIDAGANIGLFTLYMSQIFENASYCLVEPDINCIELIKLNTKIIQNIKIIPKVLMNSNTRVCFHVSFDKPTGNRITFNEQQLNNNNELRDIETITINDILTRMGKDKIDILKVDIEGSERFLFADNLEWMKKCKMIIIELHDRFYPECSDIFFKAIKVMWKKIKVYNRGENIFVVNETI